MLSNLANTCFIRVVDVLSVHELLLYDHFHYFCGSIYMIASSLIRKHYSVHCETHTYQHYHSIRWNAYHDSQTQVKTFNQDPSYFQGGRLGHPDPPTVRTLNSINSKHHDPPRTGTEVQHVIHLTQKPPLWAHLSTLGQITFRNNFWPFLETWQLKRRNSRVYLWTASPEVKFENTPWSN